MNSDIFEGKWKQVRGEIKNWWGKLTDDDIDMAEGNYDKFLGILQERYGYSRAQAEAEIEQRFTAYESKVRPIDPLSRNR
jgi:uncharacterized protein YjbJ (UPF0337 family)